MYLNNHGAKSIQTGNADAINPYTISIIAIVSPLNVNILASVGFSATYCPPTRDKISRIIPITDPSPTRPA